MPGPSSTTFVGVDVPSSAPSALFDGDTYAEFAFLFFRFKWGVELGPRRPKNEVGRAAFRVTGVKDIHDHARVRGYHDAAPFPEANLHILLMEPYNDAVHERPELRPFLAHVNDLVSDPSISQIGPHIEHMFRAVNGYEPPHRLGEMFTMLTAYMCAFSRHPDFGNAGAFRSLLNLCRAGNILFRIENETAHVLCLAT